MTEELDKVCNILDKLTLDALSLMEEEIQLKIYIENAMCGGESHLAKSRYIMGQNSVSALKLPTENGPELEAQVKVFPNKDDKYFDCVSNTLDTVKEDTMQDPIKWFGVLVPQNLHYAKKMFTQALQWSVDAVNVQRKLDATCTKLAQLKEYKNELKSK